MKKYRALTLALVSVIAVSITLAAILPIVTKADNYRYHQHLEAAEKEACEHSDGSFCTHLPIIAIETGGVEIPGRAYYDEEGIRHVVTGPGGETYITATVTVTDNESTNNHLDDEVSVSTLAEVNVRGNSSRHFSKVGYSLDFVTETGENNPESVMGMDAHHEWILHGPILDRTLIRNYMWYNISGEIMGYAPNVRFCEAFVNGEYMGLYLMAEGITAGDMDSRLSLSVNKKDNTFTGYCLRLDRGSTELKNLETFSMYSYRSKGIIDLVYPGTSNITDELKRDIQDDFSEFERSLYSYDYNSEDHGYKKYIDVDSFVDYYIINEFTSNYDAGALSTYIYKDTDGLYKLCVWDFNSACDNYQESVMDRESFALQSGVWYNMLIKDGEFVDRIIERYTELRETYLNEQYLLNYIDGTIAYLGDAVTRNNERWSEYTESDLLVPVERNPESYEEAVTELKEFITERGGWMDRNINSLLQYASDSKNKKHNEATD